jgi:hypothetical protein
MRSLISWLISEALSAMLFSSLLGQRVGQAFEPGAQ